MNDDPTNKWINYLEMSYLIDQALGHPRATRGVLSWWPGELEAARAAERQAAEQYTSARRRVRIAEAAVADLERAQKGDTI